MYQQETSDMETRPETSKCSRIQRRKILSQSQQQRPKGMVAMSLKVNPTPVVNASQLQKINNIDGITLEQYFKGQTFKFLEIKEEDWQMEENRKSIEKSTEIIQIDQNELRNKEEMDKPKNFKIRLGSAKKKVIGNTPIIIKEKIKQINNEAIIKQINSNTNKNISSSNNNNNNNNNSQNNNYNNNNNNNRQIGTSQQVQQINTINMISKKDSMDINKLYGYSQSNFYQDNNHNWGSKTQIQTKYDFNKKQSIITTNQYNIQNNDYMKPQDSKYINYKNEIKNRFQKEERDLINKYAQKFNIQNEFIDYRQNKQIN